MQSRPSNFVYQCHDGRNSTIQETLKTPVKGRVIDGVFDPLLGAQTAFRALNRGVAAEELNLFDIAAVLAARFPQAQRRALAPIERYIMIGAGGCSILYTQVHEPAHHP